VRTSVDVWLLRVSHLSTFGLFTLTLGTLYFTVIPLYQKAVLEESIAKMEVALRNLEKRSEEDYQVLRVYVVGTFSISSGFACSGMPVALEKQKQKDDLLGLTKILSIDIPDCLKRHLKKNAISLKQLRSEDYESVVEQIQKISAELELDQKKSLREFQELPARAQKDPSLLRPLEGWRAERDTQLAGIRSSNERDERRFKASIEQMQFKISDDFGQRVLTRIESLRALKWKDTVQIRSDEQKKGGPSK